MKGLIILRGISFRNGAGGDHSYGSEESIKNQFEAWSSHVKMIEQIRNKYNCNCDVLIDTQNYDLISTSNDFFGSYNLKLRLFDKQNKTQQISFNRIINENIKLIHDYDFLIITRNDIFLKDELVELINPNDSMVKFSFVLEYHGRKLIANIPIVDDNFIYVPKKHFALLNCVNIKRQQTDLHNMLWLMLLKNPNLDYDFYVYTYHCPNTAWDWNPLYRMVSRPEAKIHRSGADLIYPDDF